MGGSVSTLNTVNSAKLAHKIKEKYEDYKSHANLLTELQIQEKILEDYNTLLKALLEEQITLDYFDKHDHTDVKKKTRMSIDNKVVLIMNNDSNNMETSKSTSTLQSKIEKSAWGVKKGNERSKLSRRRSFDNALRAKLSPKKKGPSPVKELISVQDEIHEEIDVWDSVAHQPFCKLCSMAFKTMAFLERHEKFSTIHAKYVEIIENEKKNILNEEYENNRIHEEGIDYKLIYSGCKSFWRTREEVDIAMYLHFKTNIIEVITFDLQSKTLKELPRIYLNYSMLTNLAEVAFNLRIEQEFEKLKLQKEAHKVALLLALPEQEEVGGNIPQYEQIDENYIEIEHKSIKFDADLEIATFILKRLEFVAKAEILNNLNSDIVEKIVVFDNHPSDTENVTSALIVEIPHTLKPVSVVRRRRTNGEEILATIDHIDNELTAVSKAIDHADQLISNNLIH